MIFTIICKTFSFLDKYQLREYKKRLFMLKETPLFSGLSFKSLAPIFHKAIQKTLEQSDTIYRKGKTIDHVIIVETGSLEYMTFESGKTIKLLTPGNVFGVKETLEQIKSIGFLRSNERKTRILLFGKQVNFFKYLFLTYLDFGKDNEQQAGQNKCRFYFKASRNNFNQCNSSIKGFSPFEI